MNRIYRLVWSRAANCLVPVSEHISGHRTASAVTIDTGTRPQHPIAIPHMSRFCRVMALAFSPLAFVPFAVGAQTLPQGGQIVAGAGSISQSGSNVTVNQASQNLALNWQSFNIGQGNLVQFVQPSASSVVLNRVLGQDPSSILGSLSANGQVFISNPNGILFGAGAQVNVGGLVATTHSISDADFMSGQYRFIGDGSRASVVNRGTLTAADGGYIALLAPEVRNEGIVSARLGTALLAAGNQVTLNIDNGSLIGYNIDQGALNALAENKQLIKADGGQVIMSAKAADSVARAVVNNEGVVEALSIENRNGVITLAGDAGSLVTFGGKLDASGSAGQNGGMVNVQAGSLVMTGDILANGANGGQVQVDAGNILQSGDIHASGVAGAGGIININAANALIQTETAQLTANGSTAGGTIMAQAGKQVFSSARFSAQGQAGQGGTLKVLGETVKLYGADLNARGKTAGGTVLIGGDNRGNNPLVKNATQTTVNFSTKIQADATNTGNGGKVVVWADQQTDFYGNISARGGEQSGNGGQVEVSGKENLVFGGMVDAGAKNGSNGKLLLNTRNITINSAAPGVASFDLVDPNPGANNALGYYSPVQLPNGNLVVVNPYDDLIGSDAGAVYLFNSTTGGLISALVGSKAGDYIGNSGVTALTNGNYVVNSSNWANGSATSAGAVTWGSGTVGVSGVVSASNSLVGSKAQDYVGGYGVTALTNGNYVVRSATWDNGSAANAGAVTWGNGTTGIVGEVSAANSLVGSSTNDLVGSGGITALTNGNYVVSSISWHNGGAANAGAATWGSGTTGIAGEVSAANSLVGSKTNDQVGTSVKALTNGNYVVSSSYWDNGAVADAGAATWGNGTTGIVGEVSAANSLVGSTANDYVGNVVTALTNGNYVVRSSSWDNGAVADAGAATWGNGTTGIVGEVSAANSLVGSTANDIVGTSVTALTNGNYVVSSSSWDNGSATNAGAVTWGNGTTGIVGEVSAANSLVGSNTGDSVGIIVTALTNGNYVVSSISWDNGSAANAGAVTWGNGATGIKGEVSAANSLVGSKTGDSVGGRVTALTNGNYVVTSSSWDNGSVVDAGAVTWGNGATGTTGVVSASNSLVGSKAQDNVGISSVTALTNGNYVVSSSSWDNGSATNAGAVTWGNGTTGITGEVSAANSLVGSKTGDSVGSRVTALTNGNYVVTSNSWDNGSAANAGAVTWGNGATGTTGVVSAANSLVGSKGNDQVGYNQYDSFYRGGIVVLANGDYIVSSSLWDNGSVINAGAVTWGNGTTGTTGVVSAANSVVGSRANEKLGEDGGFESGWLGVLALSDGRALVGAYQENGALSGSGRISVLKDPNVAQTAFGHASNGSVTIAPTTIAAIASTGTDITLQASNDITLATGSSIATNNPGGNGGSLTMQAGRSILLSSDITTDNGNLALIANERLANGVVDAQRSAGAAVIAMASGTSIDTGAGAVKINLRDGAGKTNADSGDIELQAIKAASIEAVNEGPTIGSDIVLNAGLKASGTGNAIVLAGDNFINNAGATPLSAANGRWLVYSTDPGANTFGGMVSPGNLFGRSYATAAPSGIGSTFGNRFVYSVTPTLTVSANSQTRTYGDANPALTYQHSGLIDGDTADTALSGILATMADTTSNVGSYLITQGTLAEQLGYNLVYSTNSLTITARAVNLSGTKVYDGNTDLNAVSVGNLVNGDIISATGSAMFDNKHAGTGKALATSGITLTGSGASNYTLVGGTHKGSITPRALTVSASGENKTYDGTTAAGVMLSDNRISGDNLSFTYAANFDTKHAGTGRGITVTGIQLAGDDANNYTVNTTASATADIAKKSLVVKANNDSKTGNGTAYRGGNGVSYAGLAGSDTAAVLGGALTYGGTAQGAIDPGSYRISAQGLASNDYVISYVDGTLVITQPAPAQPQAQARLTDLAFVHESTQFGTPQPNLKEPDDKTQRIKAALSATSSAPAGMAPQAVQLISGGMLLPEGVN